MGSATHALNLFFRPPFCCVSTFSLNAFIKTDHYMRPLPSLSLIQSLTIKWKGNPGVSEADWQQRQRWKDEKREGAADEGTREGMSEEKNKNPRNHKAQPALTVNGLRNVLEAWLVSVSALWEGEWRSAIVEPLVHSRGKLELRPSLLKLWGSHRNH